MKRIGYSILFAAIAATTASATPIPNSVVLHERVFNDCPGSTLISTNAYPALIQFDDTNAGCIGFANLHTWRFSTDGVNAIQFQNGDAFVWSATLVLSGVAEAGLSLSPWWSPDADGQFNARTTDGEIACFGGRMPFFNFTAAYGLHYVSGTPITMEVIYNPRGLSAASPAQVTYNLVYGGNPYSSGPLNFDEGNPAEDPPHGLWGALSPWYAGGFAKMFWGQGPPNDRKVATWTNVQFNSAPTPATTSSWGKIKANYR